jgi:hypothetical protein
MDSDLTLNIIPTMIESIKAVINCNAAFLRFIATGYIGFPVGNVQLVKVYVGLALAGSVV